MGEEVFLTGLAAELASELGETPPGDIYREETLKFDSFDPADPAAYIQAQIDEYGV